MAGHSRSWSPCARGIFGGDTCEVGVAFEQAEEGIRLLADLLEELRAGLALRAKGSSADDTRAAFTSTRSIASSSLKDDEVGGEPDPESARRG